MSAEASWEEAVRSGLRATASENRVAARDEVAELLSEPGVTACTECLLTEVAKAVLKIFGRAREARAARVSACDLPSLVFTTI